MRRCFAMGYDARRTSTIQTDSMGKHGPATKGGPARAVAAKRSGIVSQCRACPPEKADGRGVYPRRGMLAV